MTRTLPAPSVFTSWELRHKLSEDLDAALVGFGGLGSLEGPLPASPLADATRTYVASDRSGRRRVGALQVSAEVGDLAWRELERARLARRALGTNLGAPILTPLCWGRLSENRSWVLWPHCTPARRGWTGRLLGGRLRGRVLAWLYKVSAVTRRALAPEEIESAYVAPLRGLAARDVVGPEVRIAASRALERVELEREVRPGALASVLTHGDLWRGNVLGRAPAGSSAAFPFTVIDWKGARVRGYPLIDLLTYAQSSQLSLRSLTQELRRHLVSLGADASLAKAYVLAGLGDLGRDLGCFPEERYGQLARGTLGTLVTAVGERSAW